MKGEAMPKPKKEEHPLNPGEAKALRATMGRLNGIGARQALLGVVNVLTTRANLPASLFGEIIDDAGRLTAVTNQKGTSTIEYAILVAGIAAVCLLAVGLLGQTLHQMFQAAADLFRPF